MKIFQLKKQILIFFYTSLLIRSLLKSIPVLLILFTCNITRAQSFTPIDYGLSDLYTSAWVDIDNDNDLDLVVHPYLFENTGTNFNKTTLPGSGTGYYMDVFDADMDNDMDFVISGSTFARIIINEGSYNFTTIELEPLVGPIVCGDLNNDGLEDIVSTGSNGDDVFIYIYKNNGSNNFVLVENNLSGGTEGKVIIFDFDKDQKNDILLAGVDMNGNPIIYLYQNQGDFVFTKLKSFEACRYEASVNIADFDNNGWMDFSISGYSDTWIVKQTSKNTFIKEDYNFTWCREGDSRAFNYDGDSDIDLIVSGFYPPETKYYTREDNDTYTATTTNDFSAYRGGLALGDYDNDSDVDYFISGIEGSTN